MPPIQFLCFTSPFTIFLKVSPNQFRFAGQRTNFKHLSDRPSPALLVRKTGLNQPEENCTVQPSRKLSVYHETLKPAASSSQYHVFLLLLLHLLLLSLLVFLLIATICIHNLLPRCLFLLPNNKPFLCFRLDNSFQLLPNLDSYSSWGIIT